MLVAAGLGWSVLPLTMLDEQLIALNLPSLHMSRALGVVSHTRRSLSNAACALRSLLAEETTE
jgi:DNA-binding transcriptional LysR family regulator